jgi:hypothetical protein
VAAARYSVSFPAQHFSGGNDQAAALHRRARSDGFDATDLTHDLDFVFHGLNILLHGEP